jgi:26S proteasome regulatory subunit N1
VLDLLTPIVQDSKVGIEVAGFAAMALGLVYVGSCNEDVAQSIVLALMNRSEAELGEPLARFLCLGLSLLYLGKQDAVDATMEVAKTFHEKISKYCQVTLDSCAYAGTGNVLKVLLCICLAGIKTYDCQGGKPSYDTQKHAPYPRSFLCHAQMQIHPSLWSERGC